MVAAVSTLDKYLTWYDSWVCVRDNELQEFFSAVLEGEKIIALKECAVFADKVQYLGIAEEEPNEEWSKELLKRVYLRAKQAKLNGKLNEFRNKPFDELKSEIMEEIGKRGNNN